MRIQLDKFNSEIFQIQMGNVIVESEFSSLESFEKKEREATKGKYKHLTLKIPTYDKKLLNIALKAGYSLVDTLVEYVFIMDKSILPKLTHKCILRDCTENDVVALKEIANNSFKIDRFHSDEYLDNELCDLYYEKWIENSYNGFAEKVIVAEYNDEPVGFTTGSTYKDDEFGHLVLSAVSNKYRGIGIYTSMIHEGISWMLREHGDLKGVIVGTQINNLAVQKAWIKLGFTVHDSVYVLQKYIGG